MDTSSLGAQNITYSAPSDAAGNIPDSINRTVTVLAKPLAITTLTITSSNANSSYAKTGDVITLNLVANGTIGSSTTVSIASTTPTPTITGQSLEARYTVESSLADTNSLAFTITTSNEDNLQTVTSTQANLPGSSIIIDNTAPTIILQGDDPFPVYTNTTFTDPGALANDHSYGDQTINTTDTPSTSVSGTFTVNYKAPDDYAGNTGPSITRTILVTDAPKINITALNISSSSSNNFARAGQTITLMLYTDSSDLTNATGTFLNREFTSSLVNGNANFTILVDSTDPNGNATFSISMENSIKSQITITNVNITDDSFVTIDTIKPVITITDASNNTVLQGNTYSDPGTEITDANNASYDGVISATALDTSILGAQNITYSAPADAAGNIPDSINRTVTVLAKPLAITTLTITSSNANSSYAKAGDVITLNLVANGTIGSTTTVSIASTTPTPTITDNSLTASYTVESSLADTNSLAFTITTSNEDNLQTVTSTQANLPGSSIIIDNTAPTIILQGDDPFLVYTNTTFTDPGARANDHSYGDQTINTTDTTSTSVPGTFTVNYKAPDDYAGNTGPSITRTILVTDAPDINITALTISSSSSNNFARADQTITLMLYTDSSDLTNATGTFLNREFTSSLVNGNANFTILVDSTDTNGNATFSITVTNSTTSKITLTKASITDGSFVTIDTVKPVIALNGNSPDTVFRGNSYTDQGVTVSDDGNNSYPQTFTASITDLDTSLLGAQNITYSAPADAAGNIPDSINRIVTVLAKPLAITTLTITSSNANSSYAKTGDVITLNLVANGTIGSSTTVSIASTTPTPTITTATVANDTLTATYTVESSLADTNSLAFTITTSNEDNLQTVTSTQDDPFLNLLGSSIIRCLVITVNVPVYTRIWYLHCESSSYVGPVPGIIV